MQPVETHLTLDRFARLLGIPPMHFWGVNIPEMEKNATCSESWFQHAWQGTDRVSRDDVAEAIAEAERDIEQLVGYRLLPTWETDEWQPTIRPFRRDAVNWRSADVLGRAQLVFGRWGHLLSGGIRSTTTIEAGAAVAYTNDSVMIPASWKNLATVVVSLSDEVPDDEIAVFYPGHAGDDHWRIRPVAVAHSATTLVYTITFAREMAMIPAFFDSYDLAVLRPALGTDDANFLATVDVARVYNDPQQQATMLWEGPSCGCGGGHACSYGVQTAMLALRGDPRLSAFIFDAAEWNADTQEFHGVPMSVCRQPDLIRLWYYAGWRDKSSRHPLIELDDQWARIVAYYAASKLDRPVCSCSTAAFHTWQTDLAFSEAGSYAMSPSDLGNPFGTRRGAVQAWRRVRAPGVAVGRAALDH